MYYKILLFITVGYLATLFMTEEHFIGYKLNLLSLSLIVFLVVLSWFVRYLRWFYLMRIQAYSIDFCKGLIAYISGFTYTISPGKVGELSRVILFNKLGVKSSVTISLCIYERLIDLICVLLLSVLALFFLDAFLWIIYGTLGLIIVIFSLLVIPEMSKFFKVGIKKSNISLVKKVFLLMLFVKRAFCKHCNKKSLAASLLMGMISWFLISLSFFCACLILPQNLSVLLVLGLYPLAMLVGALSFIPGGVGTTEAAIVAVLNSQGVSLNDALGVAILIRICTLWLAVWVGAGCLFYGSRNSFFSEAQ